jgi:hypothetical protein
LVGDDVAHDEGEGFADATEWRRDHEAFWADVAHLVRADAGDPDWQLRDAEPRRRALVPACGDWRRTKRNARDPVIVCGTASARVRQLERARSCCRPRLRHPNAPSVTVPPTATRVQLRRCRPAGVSELPDGPSSSPERSG